MRSTFLILAATAAVAFAFPSFARVDSDLEHRNNGGCVANVTGLVRIPDRLHPYRPPTKTDQRGPCPALNVMANHGYINRTGIVTLAETVKGSVEAFNMDEGVATFLALVELVYVGNPVTGLFSIGGPDNRTGPGIAAGGLDSHVGEEGDASATRFDAYFGDNHSFQPTLYQKMKDVAAKYGGQYTVEAVNEHFQNQFDYSIANNPQFTYLPLVGIIDIAAKSLIPGLFSNGTYGEGGCANEASISSIFGAQTTRGGAIVAVPERFPDNWYRRGKPYTFDDVGASIGNALATTHVRFGVNVNGVNNFVPLNVSTLPADLACTLKGAIDINLPDSVAPTVTGLLNQLVFTGDACPSRNITTG